jgi:hypothetical protein
MHPDVALSLTLCKTAWKRAIQKRACEKGRREHDQRDGSFDASDQEPETSEAKDAFVTSIKAINAISYAMMHAGSSQMTDPPHRENECHEEAVQASFLCDHTGFQVPYSAFAVLKR